MYTSSIKSYLFKRWLLHLPYWLFWIIIMSLGDSNGFGYYSQRNHNIIIPLVINTSFNAFYFYTIAFWLKKFDFKLGKTKKFIVWIFLFSSIFILIKTGAEKIYIYNYIKNLNDVPFISLIRENLYTFPVFLIGSYMFYVYNKNKQEREWLIKDKLKNELALLRAQMSPHFLFNTLNNLYSLGLQGRNDKVNTGILKLSELLRYVIYDSQQETILLSKELEYISCLIEINKLMFYESDVNNIKNEVTGNTEGYSISPMLLANFVENAFKYGVGVGFKTDISILAKIDQGVLNFSVKNNICKIQKPKIVINPNRRVGVGIKNVKRQLAVLYANDHNLDIDNTGAHFIINLTLKLKK